MILYNNSEKQTTVLKILPKSHIESGKEFSEEIPCSGRIEMKFVMIAATEA